MRVEQKSSWRFEAGDEIVPGRSALRLLGGGTRFEAYLAVDQTLLTTAVVKIVRPAFVDEAATMSALRREAAALARLNHPNILRGFDAVLDGDRPHLLLEHVEGPTLRRLIKRYGPLPLEQIVPLAVELAAGIHYLGAKRTVHLDIKPANVIMGLTPKLIDLSIARTFEELARVREPIGTPEYLAPEQCMTGAFGELGTAADVWGLGMILFRALTGKRPFSSSPPGAEGLARYPQLHEEPRPLPPTVPPQIAEIVAACLDKQASARPAPAEIADRLEAFVANLPKPVLGRRRPRFS